VRALLYGLGCTVLFLSTLSMALLPRLLPLTWRFVVGGAVLSGLIAGAWALLTAVSGDWRRPRTGHALLGAAIAAGAIAWKDGQWMHLWWSAAVLVAGFFFLLRPRPRREQGERNPGPVRPPLGR